MNNFCSKNCFQKFLTKVSLNTNVKRPINTNIRKLKFFNFALHQSKKKIIFSSFTAKFLLYNWTPLNNFSLSTVFCYFFYTKSTAIFFVDKNSGINFSHKMRLLHKIILSFLTYSDCGEKWFYINTNMPIKIVFNIKLRFQQNLIFVL